MKIIIVGGQAGGMTCAARLRRNLPDAKIMVIEKEDYVSFGACGLPYYIGEFFTDSKYLFAKSNKDIIESGIILKNKHEVITVDEVQQQLSIKNLITNDISIEDYNTLIICSGASAVDGDKNNGRNIFTIKSLNDANNIKQSLASGLIKNIAILGAGYIGLEMLEAFNKYNVNIHLIDAKPSLTHNLLDDNFEDLLITELKAHNTNIYLNQLVENITEQNNKIQISLTQTTSHLTVDMLVIAKGFKPNTSFLSNAFHRLQNGALLVNEVGKTNINNVYAFGDCSSIYHKILNKQVYIPLATIANKMGRTVADILTGKNSPFKGTIASSCLKILDLEVAKTGITEAEAKQNNIPYVATFVEDYDHTNYYPNNHKIFMKLISEPDSGIIIGAQLLGKNGAMLRIHALSVAIEKKLTVKELSMLDFAYAPPFTRTWDALNILGTVATKQKQTN